MKVLKAFGKIFVGIMVVMALAVPLFLIYQISQQEMGQYKEEVHYQEYKPSAYGEICNVLRQDMEESITVSGQFMSTSVAFQELTYKEPSKIRWVMQSGDMTTVGQTLGFYQGKPVVATVTGIIDRISLGYEDAYIQYQTIDDLQLECEVEDKILNIITEGGLTTQEGAAISVSYIAPLKNPNGTTTIRLMFENGGGYLGQFVSEMKLYTGRVFYDSLTLPIECVYQKDPGEQAPWYVRKVGEDGYLIEEVEVEIGYNNGKYICVTGVAEEEYFDSGYKAILEGQ